MRWLGWLRRKPEPEETLPLDFSAYRGNWSVQYPDRPGYVCPNCIFKTRESAEAWAQPSWSGQEGGIVFTRDGQHDPWRPAEPKSVLT